MQMVPVAIAPVRESVGRRPGTGPRAILDQLASASLALVLVPTFLYFDINLAIAAPLSLLIGLTSQHLFRLIFSPDGDVFSPTTLVAGYFAIYFALRSFYLCTVPFFARLGRNSYDDYLPTALWCACAAYVSFSAGIGSRMANRWLKRLPLG